jgi:hypothetical protein
MILRLQAKGSVLARHYSDYAPEKLKSIYEKSNISVLDEPKSAEKDEPVLLEHVHRKIGDRYEMDDAGRVDKRDPY